jgi:L,D-peptidoglycan transpeptidase YkuD (ErfK/YbiS/YcfS/YnhG family)
MADKNIIVFVSEQNSKAKVEFGDETYEVVIGKAGAIDETQKIEGDLKTPIGGPYKIMKVYYRKDRLDKPQTSVPLAALEEDDIWVDNPENTRYNQPAKRSDSSEYSSHETLYREDHLYDLLVDIGFNRENIKPGKGSAIFFAPIP